MGSALNYMKEDSADMDGNTNLTLDLTDRLSEDGGAGAGGGAGGADSEPGGGGGTQRPLGPQSGAPEDDVDDVDNVGESRQARLGTKKTILHSTTKSQWQTEQKPESLTQRPSRASTITPRSEEDIKKANELFTLSRPNQTKHIDKMEMEGDAVNDLYKDVIGPSTGSKPALTSGGVTNGKVTDKGPSEDLSSQILREKKGATCSSACRILWRLQDSLYDRGDSETVQVGILYKEPDFLWYICYFFYIGLYLSFVHTYIHTYMYTYVRTHTHIHTYIIYTPTICINIRMVVFMHVFCIQNGRMKYRPIWNNFA